MYTPLERDRAGLGFVVPWDQLLSSVILPIGATAGGALATRLIAGSSSPSQKDIEAQLKLRAQLDIQRMQAQQHTQQQQTESLMRYALPAAGVFALVMLLR